MPYPKDDPAWAMLEALDLWGDPFLRALDDPQAYQIWLDSTPPDIALTVAMSSVTGDILNGGTEQCFWNSFGTASPEAVKVIRAVGLLDYARLVEQAMARFGPVYPRSRDERMAAIDSGAVELADIDEDLIDLIVAHRAEYDRRLNDFAADVLRRYPA